MLKKRSIWFSTPVCHSCSSTVWTVERLLLMLNIQLLEALSKGVLIWENSHRPKFHTGMTFWFRIAFTWWVGHFISCYLTVHFMLIKYTLGSKSQTIRMRYPFQSTGRPISHRNGWSFRVYMIPLRDFVLEWNSRSGVRTGVNSRRGDSRRHNILWWYHVNKYRAMRGNQSELTPGSCKHPLSDNNMHERTWYHIFVSSPVYLTLGNQNIHSFALSEWICTWLFR